MEQSTGYVLTPSPAMSNTVATSHLWVFKLKLIKMKSNKKCSSLATLAIIQGSMASGGYLIGQCRYRAFPSLQQVLLDSVERILPWLVWLGGMSASL